MLDPTWCRSASNTTPWSFVIPRCTHHERVLATRYFSHLNAIKGQVSFFSRPCTSNMASIPAASSPLSPAKSRSIRPHRKSRTGCKTCKRRKVKCDEGKPCGNCNSFGVTCDLAPEAFVDVPSPVVSAKRRGRGRPRKDWTLEDTSASTPNSVLQELDGESLNIGQAELLLHFLNHTSRTLADDTPMIDFWKHNAPQIGVSQPFVLHLILALGAFHLTHKTCDSSMMKPTSSPSRRSRNEYLSLARRHFTAGLSGFTAQLSHPTHDNCGALYLGAMVTTYCTFADGPTSLDDLLICTTSPTSHEDEEGQSSCVHHAAITTAHCTWMPFVRGVHLLRSSFTPDVLFGGLMNPFNSGSSEETLSEPVCVRDGFRRLDWEHSCLQLSDWVGGGSNDACRLAMNGLICIYAATYGYSRADGGICYNGPSINQFVFGWLYRMDQTFVECVRRREPRALLILAYYAVLLNQDTVRHGWYIEGWNSHIIDRVGKMLGEENGRRFMQWPEQVVHELGKV